MNFEKGDNPLGLAYSLAVPQKGIVALYGAGGKTTLLYRLAQELAGKGDKVLLTTTTKIFRPEGIPAVIESDFKLARAALHKKFQCHNLVILGSALLPNDKFDGIEPAWPKELLTLGLASHILIEADGANHHPVKGYASYEPVLPREADLIIPIQGLDALGSILNEKNIHRPLLFMQATGAFWGEPLTPFYFSRSLLQMIARGREQSPRARIVPLLNKVDLLRDHEQLQVLATKLASSSLLGSVDRVLFTALQEENPVKYVFALSPGFAAPFVSCVLLAAGSSRRMGKDKLFLPLKGKTVLEHALQNAVAAGMGEVIVVTRPESYGLMKGIVEKVVRGAQENMKRVTQEVAEGAGEDIAGRVPAFAPAPARVKVITNPRHHCGISSSLQAGLAAVNPLAQGAIFALGDQPFIPAEVYNLLLEHYTRHLNLLTYPRYEGQRGNPALFDRRAWPALMALFGDAGGRQVISSFPVEEVCAVDTRYPGILADLDTPEDWEKYSSGRGPKNK